MSSVTGTPEFNGLIAAGVFSGASLMTLIGVFVFLCYGHYQKKLEKERIYKLKSKQTGVMNGVIRNGGPPKPRSKPPFKRKSGGRRSLSTTRSLPYPVRGRPVPPGHVMALPTFAGGMSAHYGYGPMLLPYPPISDWERDTDYSSDSPRSSVSRKHRKKHRHPKAEDAVRPQSKGKNLENGIKPREITVIENESEFIRKDDVDNNANSLNLLQGEIILKSQNSPLRHSSRQHSNEVGGDNWTYSNVRDNSRLANEEPDMKPGTALETSQKEPAVELRKVPKRVERGFADPRHHDVATVEAEIIISRSKSVNKVTTDTAITKSERDSANVTSFNDRDISWYLHKQVEIIENSGDAATTVAEKLVTKTTEAVQTNSNTHEEQSVDLEVEPKVDYNISLESQDLLRILQRRQDNDTEGPDATPPVSRSSPKELHFGFSYTTTENVYFHRQRNEKDGVDVLPPADEAHIDYMDIPQPIVKNNHHNEATPFQSVLSELKRKRSTIDGDDDNDSEDSISAQRNAKSVQFSQNRLWSFQ